MVPSNSKTLIKTIFKRLFRPLMSSIPEGALKLKVRTILMKTFSTIPAEYLVNPGDTSILIGFHRIDSVMLWSSLVGKNGHVIVIEAVPDYVENIRNNLECHLNWPLKNISYITKGVDSKKSLKHIQIGQRADFNKIMGQSIEDGLSDADFIQDVQIETDTIDQILKENKISKVDHIHITISGMEIEALKGMTNTLKIDGLRLHIRSLHKINNEVLYLKVLEILNGHGMKSIVSPGLKNFEGRDIYSCRV